MQPDYIAKKIRKNLLDQKKRLEKYLTILEKEGDDIENADADKLLLHIEIEKDIVNELVSFKKILEPLEVMYYNSPYKKDESLIDIKSSITNLSDQIKVKSDENKEKLEIVLENVKTDLKSNKKNNVAKSVYGNVDSRLVDICG